MSQVPPAIESDKPAHDLPLRKQTSFRGDVLRLVSGTGIAQLIAILAAPILTRINGPKAFGVAALFASLTAIISVVACLRCELRDSF